MPANIQSFISSFKNEAARPCNFDVLITPNINVISKITSFNLSSIFTAFSLSKAGELMFRCEAAELPSRTFALVDQKTYGPIELYPIQNSYDKINFTFICSDDMKEKMFFDAWMEIISPSTPLTTVTSLLNLTGVRFDFEYKNNYESIIMVNQYDLTGQISYRAVLLDAFPVSVNQLPLFWRETDSYHRLVVTFAYRYFTMSPV